MKLFLRSFLASAVLAVGFKAALAQIELSSAAENAISASALEQALYRLMPLPACQVLARRVPAESRVELDTLLKQASANADLFAIRAQEDERQLDFKAAEQDWRQAARLSHNKQAALINLADFYSRRLEPQLEVQALLQAAGLPAEQSEKYKTDREQSAWQLFQQALDVSSAAKWPADARANIYESWIRRYPRQTEPLREYFQSLLAAKDLPAAHNVSARIRSAFPNNLSLNLESDAELARAENGDPAAMASLRKAVFTPLAVGSA